MEVLLYFAYDKVYNNLIKNMFLETEDKENKKSEIMDITNDNDQDVYIFFNI